MHNVKQMHRQVTSRHIHHHHHHIFQTFTIETYWHYLYFFYPSEGRNGYVQQKMARHDKPNG